MHLLLEATLVGLIILVVGTAVGYGVGAVVSSDLPPVCRDWNKFYVMEISLFLTGAVAHLLCEWAGINRWYCKYGRACH